MQIPAPVTNTCMGLLGNGSRDVIMDMIMMFWLARLAGGYEMVIRTSKESA